MKKTGWEKKNFKSFGKLRELSMPRHRHGHAKSNRGRTVGVALQAWEPETHTAFIPGIGALHLTPEIGTLHGMQTFSAQASLCLRVSHTNPEEEEEEDRPLRCKSILNTLCAVENRSGLSAPCNQ